MMFYTFAAENLDLEASLVLGNKFLRGYNAPKSCIISIPYFRMAAQHGKSLLHGKTQVTYIFFSTGGDK